MLREAFKNFIGERAFPCTGAHASQATGQLRMVEAADFSVGDDDPRLLEEIYRFIDENREAPNEFRSLVILFRGPTDKDEAEFERTFWQRLQAWHELDRQRFPWAEGVSQDPQNPHFRFSLGGEAFYVIGMHPGSSRRARRFQAPAIVLNLHSQFEALRARGKYMPMRDNIRKRDQAYSGSVNPMLADFGESSEASQYSGRAIDRSWKCPFHASA